MPWIVRDLAEMPAGVRFCGPGSPSANCGQNRPPNRAGASGLRRPCRRGQAHDLALTDTSATSAQLRRLASAIKARWVGEQAHQQIKEELGLDHSEDRSWTSSTGTCR